MPFPIVTDVPRELLPHIQSGMLRLDADAEVDAQSKARLLGITEPLLTIAESFDEVQRRVKLGWTVTEDGCPISGFPLLRSPDGKIIWSVRAQMPTMTREKASESQQKEDNSFHSDSPHSTLSVPFPDTTTTVQVPLPDLDDVSEKVAAAKASAVHLNQPLLSVKEAFNETSQRLLQGWVLMNETCPVSNFPLLRSQDGRVVWSVRCQCEIATEGQASQRGLTNTNTNKASSSSRAAAQEKSDEDELIYPVSSSSRTAATLRSLNSSAATSSSSSPRRTERDARFKAQEAARNRQSAMISQKLLQGWKMLSETCPETHAVPLMEEPGTGRQWSAATQRFVGEMAAVEPQPLSPARSGLSDGSDDVGSDGGLHSPLSSSYPYRSDQPAPESPILQAQGRWQPPTAAEQKEMEERQRRSDGWSKKMSQMLLQGWKMLDTLCPVTHEVPLMQHPKTGRNFFL